MRGRKTAGYGARKKHRGKGSRGGKGMAGTGKRADTKKTWILAKIGSSYFGKRGFTSLKKKGKAINLDQVSEQLQKLLEKKFAIKDAKGDITIDLTKAGYQKLLGRGNIDRKLTIKVNSYSKKAKEKIEKIGETIISEKQTAEKEKEDKQADKINKIKN